MTADEDHKHYLKISAEPMGKSLIERTCRACNGLILEGKPFAWGTMETCNDPGVEQAMIWCWTCFKNMGRGVQR